MHWQPASELRLDDRVRGIVHTGSITVTLESSSTMASEPAAIFTRHSGSLSGTQAGSEPTSTFKKPAGRRGNARMCIRGGQSWWPSASGPSARGLPLARASRELAPHSLSGALRLGVSHGGRGHCSRFRNRHTRQPAALEAAAGTGNGEVPPMIPCQWRLRANTQAAQWRQAQIGESGPGRAGGNGHQESHDFAVCAEC